MANCVFGFPIYSDDSALQTPAFSGGSWLAGLPLNNLKHRKLSKVARSTDAALSSTRFRVNLGVDRTWRVVALPKTNFSPTAKWRVLSTVAALPFRYEAGQDISLIGGTFARPDATTCATQQDRHGIFRMAAANVIRDGHYINGVQHFLREDERQNLALNSSNFVGGGSWLGDTSFTLAAAQSCIEGQTAYRHTDDGGGNRARTQIIGTFAGGGQSDVAYCIVESVTSDRAEISLFDLTAGVHVHYARVTFATGAFFSILGSGGGGVVNLGNGRYLLWVSGVGTAGNVRRVLVYPSGAAANTNTTIVHHAQLEPNVTSPSSPIVTAGAALTRAADVLEFDVAALDVPFALTAFAEFVDLGIAVNARIWQISGPNDAGPRLLAYRPSNLSTFHQNASGGSSVSSQLGSAPAFRDRVELRSTFAADGAVQTHQSINGGAESSAAASAALAPAVTWGSTGTSKLYIGSTGTPNLHGSFALKSIRFMAGSANSLATMEDSVYDSGWLDGYPAGHDAETLDGINVSLVHIPAAAKTSQILDIQIDDSLNPDGYVDLARLIVAGGYQPTVNMSYGAELGLETDTIRQITDGGAADYQPKPVRRTKRLILERLDQAEAFANAWQIQRRLGKHGQLFFVSDAADTTLMHERSFLAVMRELTALEYPYPLLNAMAFELVEEL